MNVKEIMVTDCQNDGLKDSENELLALKRLCFVAHEGIQCRLCGKKVTNQQKRAIKAVRQAMRYLYLHEPVVYTWE